eukprot:8707130-Pyramimonas_sp.AAC.1
MPKSFTRYFSTYHKKIPSILLETGKNSGKQKHGTSNYELVWRYPSEEGVRDQPCDYLDGCKCAGFS